MVAPARYVQLGPFKLDRESGELIRADRRIRLPDQAFRILCVLLERPGEVVTREELRARLWAADTFVDFDAGLNNAVKKLRDALDDSTERPRFVQTVPRRGYRLIAPSAPPVPRRPALAAVMVVVALIAGAVMNTREKGAPAIESLVVLPFADLSGAPGKAYFVEGIEDALTANLAQIPSLRVIPRTSARHYKGTSKRLTEIARELGIDAAVEGSIALSADRVIVRIQLSDARADRTLWVHAYDRRSEDLLELQQDIALDIARAVHVRVTPGDFRRRTAVRSVPPEAHDDYLRGRFEWHQRSPAGMLRAIEFFRQATEKDPEYAAAYAGLADAYRLLDVNGLASPHFAMPRAEAAARKALELDDSLPEAHASLAGVLYRYRWDWQGAEREFRLSLALAPNYAEAHRGYGMYLLVMRRFEEGLEAHRRARDLDPLSLTCHVEFLAALYSAGKHRQAVAESARIRALFQGTARLDAEEGYEHLRRRRWHDAIAAFERTGPSARTNPWLGMSYGLAGRPADARAVLEAIERRSREQYIPPYQYALVHFGLNERDEGFRLLEQSYAERAFELRTLTEGLFDLLRDDARFQDLLRRLGLASLLE